MFTRDQLLEIAAMAGRRTAFCTEMLERSTDPGNRFYWRRQITVAHEIEQKAIHLSAQMTLDWEA